MGAIKLIRHIMTGFHRQNTRIWIEPVALEAAGFKVGDHITQIVTKDALILRLSQDASNHRISKRKRSSWAYERPLYETCNKEVTVVIQPRERVDMLISEGMIVIRKERSFDLFVIGQPQLQGNDLKKLRLYSAPAGAGIATAAAIDTGLFEPVGAVDIWDAAIAAYMHNFRTGCVYWGDLKRKHSDYIPEADVCWLSPACVEYSRLGSMSQGIVEGHGPHYARMVMATGASAVIIEQVPAYFKSTSYSHLKRLIRPQYPIVHETVIDAYHVGSVASRERGYAVFFRDWTSFCWPTIPRLPDHRRKTVKTVIGENWEGGDWRKIEGSVMEGLLQKQGNNNFKADKNHTLVTLESKRISAIVANYRRYQVTSSYLKHPTCDTWRPFRSDELAAFLNIPDFFEFPEWMGEGERVKLIGQSVDCNVVRAIQIEVATAIMEQHYRKIARGEPVYREPVNLRLQEDNGQFMFDF